MDLLADTLERLGIDEMGWAPANFYPTARGRRHAFELPQLDDLLPHASRIAALSRLGRAWWHNLEAYTEARHVQRALAGKWSHWSREDAISIGLVCRRNLDVHAGKAGLYGPRHGNLRIDGPAVVLERAVAHGPVSDDALYLPGLELPPVEDLARRYGDPDGREIHFWHGSVRYRWLDRMFTCA